MGSNEVEKVPDWISGDSRQAEVYDAFFKEGEDQWTWLYRSVGTPGDLHTTQYSALLPEARAGRALADPNWDVRIGDGAPGFAQSYREGVETTTYERSPREAELLVRRRHFHGLKPEESEVVDELRLFFNLWEDKPNGTYYCFDDAGNPIKAVVISEDGVKILTRLLRRYQAAKQMHLGLYLDSAHLSDDLAGDEVRWEQKDGEAALRYFRGDTVSGERPFSRLHGKRILAPPPIESSGVWPFEEEEQFEDFVIGLDKEGKEISNTANPDELANYFGANPGEPHYLTPVYFRREVLNKYYADTDRYSVEDGYIRCAGLWGLRMDNDQEDYIMVFLGDLGRDIPYGEARYWRSFNIPPPDEGPSETLVRRAFDAEFADPESVDLRLPQIYKEANEAWERCFGKPLFLPLHQDDRHVMSKLHVPITDGAAEFDEQVLYMAKLLVDSLNEAAITAEAGKGPKGEKGLGKLQRLLEEKGVKDAKALMSPIASIQGLRSRGSAHRKGSDFDISVAIGDLNRRDGFKKLMQEAADALERLKAFAEENAKS